MPNPKRKLSRSRRDSRRSTYKAPTMTIAKDTTTGEAHLFHRAHWFEGKLYYKGKVV
ncbi:MAG: 50S ribosomal protein L32, partial [Bacteroidia bacterium]|nr:50S ribosomal protein L32 [Bacteroidia bacterium]